MQSALSVNPFWDLVVSKSSSTVDISQLDEIALQAQEAFYWDNRDSWVLQVDESNNTFIERSIEFSKQISRYSHNCRKIARKLNVTLPISQHLCPVNIKPRDPKILMMAMEPVFKEFHMDDTSPTTLGCKRFTRRNPGEKYKASTMLQFVSLSFESGQQKPLSIYGFVAVRDDCEPLRNYVFNCSRDATFDVSPVSLLPLTSPIRGISLWHKAMVEINLKAKSNGDTCEDVVLVDACIDFRWDRIKRGKVLKSRIDGPFGTLYMDYVFIKHGIEAVVEIDIPKNLIGCHVTILARNSGFKKEVMIYDAVVTEASSKVSAVIAACHRGNLYFGFLVMDARAYDCITFKVNKYGCQKRTLVFPQSQPTKSSSQLQYLTLKDGKQSFGPTIALSKGELPYAQKLLGIRDNEVSDAPPGAPPTAVKGK